MSTCLVTSSRINNNCKERVPSRENPGVEQGQLSETATKGHGQFASCLSVWFKSNLSFASL